MKCASYIHIYYYDFVEELHKMFPTFSEDELGQMTLDTLLIPDGGDAASYFLVNPNKCLYRSQNENIFRPFFTEHFPEETGIYIDID